MSRIDPRLTREDYETISRTIQDPDWPATYDGWLERAAKENTKSGARGEVVKPVQVNAQEFADWSRRSGLKPSLDTFRAFAVAKARGKH